MRETSLPLQNQLLIQLLQSSHTKSPFKRRALETLVEHLQAHCQWLLCSRGINTLDGMVTLEIPVVDRADVLKGICRICDSELVG